MLNQQAADQGAGAGGMTTQFVDTDSFWELMCDLRFVRLSIHTGKIEDLFYFVPIPPEQAEGFMEGIRQSIVRDLGA